MKPEVSRAVTRCVVCHKRFKATRKDARYCSGACRQSASRARSDADDLDRQIDAAKDLYWSLLRKQAEARCVSMSQVLTEQAQSVDVDGNVYVKGKFVGHTTPHRPGWAAWGLEAAGPDFSPPTDYFDEEYRPHKARERKDGNRKRREAIQSEREGRAT